MKTEVIMDKKVEDPISYKPSYSMMDNILEECGKLQISRTKLIDMALEKYFNSSVRNEKTKDRLLELTEKYLSDANEIRGNTKNPVS